MPTITLESNVVGPLRDDKPIPAELAPHIEVVQHWNYLNQPYLAGSAMPAPVFAPGGAAGISYTGEAHLESDGFQNYIKGSQTITYPEELVDSLIGIWGIYSYSPPTTGFDFSTGQSYTMSSASINNALTTFKIGGTDLAPYDVANPSLARQEVQVYSEYYINIERKWGDAVTTAQTNSNSSIAPTGFATFVFNASADVRDGNRKRLYFRTRKTLYPELYPNTTQLNSSWVEFLLPPVCHAVLTIAGDVATLDCSKSFDCDDGIEHFNFKIGSTSIDSIISQTGFRVFQFSVAAARGLTGQALATGSTLTVAVTAVDASGNTATTTPGALIPIAATYRARALVRPTGRIVGRAKSVLWQYRDEGRVWALDLETGAVLASDDEGTTWTNNMAFPWQGVAGAIPLDATAVGFKGVCSVARVGNDIVSRYSPDRGLTWGNQVVAAPAGSTPNANWCLLSHLPTGADTVTLTNQTDVRRDSDNCCDSWSPVT